MSLAFFRAFQSYFEALCSSLQPAYLLPSDGSERAGVKLYIYVAIRFHDKDFFSEFKDWLDFPACPVEIASSVVKYFPLQHWGLVLIFGPLPRGALSYPHEYIFKITNPQTPTENEGYGLMFGVEGENALVQYGNSIQRLLLQDLEQYDSFVTGLPPLSSEMVR